MNEYLKHFHCSAHSKNLLVEAMKQISMLKTLLKPQLAILA